MNIPLADFESKFFTFKSNVVKNIPRHATVRISLWKLGFIFPEDQFFHDIVQSFKIGKITNEQLNNYKNLKHSRLKEEQTRLINLLRDHGVACRGCFLACFYFIEAYLNGVAWDWVKQHPEMDNLSKKKQALISDSNQATLKDKIMNYPNIIAGKPLWKNNEPLLETFFSDLKPFRDSLVHPSPFAVPEKFGGYDKLAKIYELKFDETRKMVDITYKLILKVHKHIKGGQAPIPNWLQDLKI